MNASADLAIFKLWAHIVSRIFRLTLIISLNQTHRSWSAMAFRIDGANSFSIGAPIAGSRSAKHQRPNHKPWFALLLAWAV
ncbi:MAG: hypothetical protein DMG96_24230 [Acidobacteria bacterium]|nr:MAG: hypothetical protein DMG96_24230 [Acidobacteriota bacterium]